MLKPAYQKILYLSRPVSRRHPMAIGKRAKQFAPFAALKGFEEEIREKEIRYEEKRILPDEKLEELDRTFRMLKVGTDVEVEYFFESARSDGSGTYHISQGTITHLSGSWIEVEGHRIVVADIANLKRWK